MEGHLKVQRDSRASNSDRTTKFPRVSFDMLYANSRCTSYHWRASVFAPLYRGHTWRKNEGVLSTAKDAIVDTAKAGP